MKDFLTKEVTSAWKDTFKFEPSTDEFNIIYSIIVKLLVLLLTIFLTLGSLIPVIFVHNVYTWLVFLGLLIVDSVLFIFINIGLVKLYKCLTLDVRSEFYIDTKSKEE